jgi:hypothetical protein
MEDETGGHVARMGDDKRLQNYSTKKEERQHKNLGINGRIILEWILEKVGGSLVVAQHMDLWVP